jgi:hypothetical protein
MHRPSRTALEDRVEGDETGGVFGVSFGQFVPYDDHGNAARQANHDKASHVFGIATQENDGEGKHQKRANHPILQQREAEDFLVAEDLAQFFVADFSQRRVHHQDESHGNGNRSRANAEAIEKGHDPGQRPSRRYPNQHGGENPQR